jgi:hypothetical protein
MRDWTLHPISHYDMHTVYAFTANILHLCRMDQNK